MKNIQLTKQSVSKPFKQSWMSLLGLSVGCVSFALSTTAMATSCPSGGVDTGDDTVTAVFALPDNGEGSPSCGSTQVGGVFVTTDQQINTNSSVMIALPDGEPSGASNPVRTYMFLPEGSTPIAHTVTCAEAAISTSSNVNSITLEDGASCDFTMQGNSGTDGGEVIYTATLTRTGEIYSVSEGEVCGAPYDACVEEEAEAPAEEPVACPSGGVDTGDDTVTAVFALPDNGEGSVSCGSTQVGGVFVTTDQQINTNSSVMIALPDTEPSGASNPVRTYMFLPEGSTPIAHTVTCAEAAISTSSNVNSITLEDGTSCDFTMQGNSGTDGGEVVYTATLTRTGEIYSLSDGEVCGAPFAACATNTEETSTEEGTYEEGKQACIDNPADCDLFSQDDINEAITTCVTDPASCGIEIGAELPYYDIETASLQIPALLLAGEVYQATLRLNTNSLGDISFDLLSLTKNGVPLITHSSLAE
ncbi:hypothetical protein [Candidatus Albibeggiatoa sp. nov. NOAA]|uniref:hypothetical protein n=1 Tax=Candidatus Albibeggiatoa sp. nov. NOAA TaxID=3162724 RepID=UPI0032F82C9E|nr:hypothetical protein [Thiotrichaceae bacterium]